MALKRHFTDEEKHGLTKEEIKIGEKYLRKFKTAGAIPEAESMKLYELFMVGCSFYEIHQQYPQYPVDKIVLTASLRKWMHDREKMMGSLRDRVQAKVVKSVIEQVDFLTTMLSVTNAEHLGEMKKYVQDPENNVKPDIRVQNIKEYKEVVETLYKLVAGATSSGVKSKASPMFGALDPAAKAKKLPETSPSKSEDDVASMIAANITE
jgi:hypothetical protein